MSLDEGTRRLGSFGALALVAAARCVSSGGGNARVDTGATGVGAAGNAGAAGSGGGAGRGFSATSGLPIPSVAANVLRTAGTPGNLQVINWAGFKAGVSYTIDDGQPSQIEHYAELQATGARMTFFINSSATWQPTFTSTFTQARSDGHEIGNHTADHCHADPDGTVWATDANNQRIACPGASAGAEFDACTTFITSTLGAPGVWTSASPFGETGFEAAASERFFLNRGVQGGTVAPNDSTNPLKLPIWGSAENDTVDRFNAAIDGAHSAGRWVIMLLHSIAPTTARWFATVDISAITGSIDHAKSLGDMWIDSMANVGAYWRGQKVLSSVTPTTEGTSQTWTWTLPAHFPPGRYLRVTVDGGTLSQGGQALAWDDHGYYEVALDAGSLTLAP